MMYRILKTQNLSYSMIQSCLKDHRLIRLLDKSKSNQFILWMQMRCLRLYPQGKKEQKQSLLVEIAEKTEMQNRYKNMLKLLDVGSKVEEERLAEMKRNELELKERVEFEVQTTGIPAVIRGLAPSLYLNKCYSYSGVLYYPTPLEWYFEAEHPFQTSEAYDRLCLKLNLPYYLVTGFCGRQALFKLCEVTKPGDSLYSFYDDEQALNELFEVVMQIVSDFEKEDLMKLIHYEYVLKDFSSVFNKKVVSRFMILMNEDKYSISDLLDFLDILKQVDSSRFIGNQLAKLDKFTRKIWDYISRRPQSIPVSLLRKLYNDAPVNHEAIFPVLDKVLIDNLDLLDVSDVFYISKEMQSRDNLEMVAILSVWLERNLNNLKVFQLKTLLPKFLESQYINPLLLKFLPKMMLSRSVMRDTQLLAHILSYCTLGQQYDTYMLEIACGHYIEDKQGYTSEQLHTLLKAIGTLNYVPDRQREFFTKVEQHLMENFYNIDVLTLLEMIVDLIYIDKVAVNFRQYIFAPLFLGIITEMKDEERVRATRCIRIIEKAFTARRFEPKLTLPVDQERSWIKDGTYDLILPVFTSILGDESHVLERSKPTGSGMYLEMQYNVFADKAGMEARFHDNDKLAFLVMTEDSFCKNNKDHMLGEEMTNIRLLQEQGLTVVWVHSEKIEELDKKNKLNSFVKALFLQILETAEENLQGSAGATENVDTVSRGESGDKSDDRFYFNEENDEEEDI